MPGGDNRKNPKGEGGSKVEGVDMSHEIAMGYLKVPLQAMREAVEVGKMEEETKEAVGLSTGSLITTNFNETSLLECSGSW